jgi:hypothetical protein
VLDHQCRFYFDQRHYRGRTVEWSSALGSQHPAPSTEDAPAQNTNARLRTWVTRSSAQRPGTETEDSETHKIGCRIFSYCEHRAVADSSDNLKRPKLAHASRSQDQKCPGLGRGKFPPLSCFIYPQLIVFVISKSKCITHTVVIINRQCDEPPYQHGGFDKSETR